MALFRSCYRTDQGWGGVIASERGLVEVLLPFGSPDRAACERLLAARHPDAVAEDDLTLSTAALMERYFKGEPVAFALPLDVASGSKFRDEVIKIVAAIPWGVVMSYGEVAAASGNPGAARAVGGVMARNPLPVVIPCHRVVGASGALTGYSAVGGVSSKRWLLALEGVDRFGSALFQKAKQP
jgi:methylated-DNA-[protein]-cysteine S-methyltransferase